MLLTLAVKTGTGLQGLAASLATMLETIGGLLLIAIVGWKALHYLAVERLGAAIGIVVIAVFPAMFLLDSAAALSFLQSTAQALGV